VTNPAQYWNTVNSTPAQASAKSYIPETTWNESCAQSGQLGGCKSVSSDGSDLVAASGGPSNCASSTGTGACVGGYSKPSWQSGPGVPSDGARDIPDIGGRQPRPGFLLQSEQSLSRLSGRWRNLCADTGFRGHHRAGQSENRPAPRQCQLRPLSAGGTKWLKLHLERRSCRELRLYIL
jgi:hypothetical protein